MRLAATEPVIIDNLREWACTICEITFEDGTRQSYFIPLLIAERTDGSSEGACIAVGRFEDRPYRVLDALQDDRFCRDLERAIRSGETISLTRGTLKFSSSHLLSGPSKGQIEPVIRPKVEQSNSSFFLGTRISIKIYRQIQHGVNPEFEIGKFLTEHTSFPHAARLGGALEFMGNEGEIATLAILQEYIPNRGDGWNHTLARLNDLCDALENGRNADPETLSEQMERLGERIGNLHAVLASTHGDPAFEPEPVTEEDWSGWRNSIELSLGQTIGDLGRTIGNLPSRKTALIEELCGSFSGVQAWLKTFNPDLNGIRKSRIHGDLHLGQVLVTDDDFVIIDFEGEPSRPIRTRRDKALPMRDVAGMVRSFSYATRMTTRQRAAGNSAFDQRLAKLVTSWETIMIHRFLKGYRQGAADCVSVPQERALFNRLLSLFLLEKALYECAYEMNNRPDWIDIPVSGLREIVGSILHPR
ncbi:MAG TPA: phosphotransferase [Candidatus Ozemobacteraceae bacterium]|nr:phosphotransferase [Candidatus Ozemobacteraceae bacterium]